MLELKKKGETTNTVIYNYYPEGKTDWGELVLNKETHTVLEDYTKANNDNFGLYLSHAIKRIESYSGKYPEKDIVAWS